MALSIDRNTLVIFVPKADLILISGTKYSFDIDAFRLELKGIEGSAEGAPFDDTHRHVTEITISGVTYARFIEIINGYTVEFEDGQYTAVASGANHNVADVVVENQVSLVTQNSAGLTAPSAPSDIAAAVWSNVLASFGVGTAGRAQLLAAYANSIWIDVRNGVAGIVLGTNGIPGNPVDNLADAVILATALGVRSYVVRGNLTLVSAHDDWEIKGLGTEPVVSLNGQDVQDSYFENIELSGDAVTSRINAQDCTLDGVSNVLGAFIGCRLINNVSLAPGGSVFSDCRSFVPGSGTPVLDVQGAGRTFNMRAYSGGIEIRNMSDAGNVGTIELIAGQVVSAASCTAGELALRGVGTHTNNSAGTVINTDSLLNKADISETVHTRAAYSKRDQIVYTVPYDGSFTARERWFPTNADAANETNVTDTFDVTATTDGITNKRLVSFDKIRDV